MNKAVKVGVIGLVAYGLFRAIGLAGKAANIQDNLYVSPAFKSATMQGLTPLVTFSVEIRNISGISLKVRNLFSKLYLHSGEKTTEIGFSDVVNLVDMPTGRASTFDSTFRISGITALANILRAQKISIVTYYEVAGQRLSYTSNIELTGFVAGLKKTIGLSGAPEATDLSLDPNTGIYSII
jgi:hypothetical protein